MANFNEAHTRIHINNRPDDYAPIRAINFGETVVVSEIAESLVNEIPIGSEIIEIDNIPVAKYIYERIAPYIPTATPHWKFDKSVTEMFYGEPGSKMQLTVKTPAGKTVEAELTRDFILNGASTPMAGETKFTPITIRMLPDNIGYIHLSSFGGNLLDVINNTFTEHLPQLQQCKGIIIDVRGNRGGSDACWENIVAHFMQGDEFKDKGKWLCRKHITTYSIWGEYDAQLRDYYEGTAMQEVMHAAYKNKVDEKNKLRRPLVVLSGRHVGSAAEDFVSILKENSRGLIVGEPTVGCMGEPAFTELPGGYLLMYCAKKYISPDGTQPNDTGLLPDIEVKRSYEAYKQGRDNQLERAIEELIDLIEDKG